MTYLDMSGRRRFRPILTTVALLTLGSLTGCSTLHGWARGGSGHSPTGGATISVPLGK